MIPEEYKQKVQNGNTHWTARTSHYTHLRNLMQRFAPDAKTLLDVGCAEGREIYLLQKDGFVAEGLEVNPKLIEKSKEMFPGVKIHEGNLLEYETETAYDVVTCYNTLFYMDEVKALKKISEIIRPRGIAIVTLDERIVSEGKTIHACDINEVLEPYNVLYKEYSERVDEMPFPHKHHFFTVVLRKQ